MNTVRAKHIPTTTDDRRAKKMRQEPTSGEEILWYYLRHATKNSGLKFRRQHPIHPYIADFVCLALKLVIEVDGETHSHTQAQDEARTKYLEKCGYSVLRFTNHEVISDRDSVVRSILDRANEVLRAT